MKELSVEQKAKRYDEAIERYKAKQEYESQKVHEFIEYLFPELKENKDERMRKELIKTFKSLYQVKLWNGIERTKILAWLEKQGNNINCIYDKELSKLLHVVICRYINDPNISYSERENVSKKILPYVELLEKQGEQNLIMAKSPQLGERKPTWSEEDEVMIKIFDSIIRYIVEVVDKDVLERFGTKREELFSWLKSLKDRVQPKQEWSEEEEENFKKAIRVLKVNNFHHTADMLQEMKYKLIPREKANWKPSDEQMKTLQEVIDVGYFTSYPNSLETLYEQLKKLKGE